MPIEGKEFRGKTLGVLGSESRFTVKGPFNYEVNDIEETFKIYFPKSQLHILEGGGHLIYKDKPSEILNLLSTFLKN